MASRSDVGDRGRNEDYLQHGTLRHGWFAVLSDGAGGHHDGAVAADLVVRIAAHELGKRSAARDESPALDQVIRVANDALNRRQEGARGRDRMHATVVLLWINRLDMGARWSHVGDSRLYRLRRGRMAEVTRDDTLVQRLVDARLITPQEARVHAKRNQLMAAVGGEDALTPHLSGPDFRACDGDAFLLCSDGWYDCLEAQDIEACLADAGTIDEWLDAMGKLVQARRRPNQDNFSAVAVWVVDPSDVTRAREAPRAPAV